MCVVDLFLMCRIAEYRKKMFSTTASIVKAVYETGSIITAAGIIMAVAFSGLLFSDIEVLNMVGFIMASSVIFDTFVVRTILVPAIMAISTTNSSTTPLLTHLLLHY